MLKRCWRRAPPDMTVYPLSSHLAGIDDPPEEGLAGVAAHSAVVEVGDGQVPAHGTVDCRPLLVSAGVQACRGREKETSDIQGVLKKCIFVGGGNHFKQLFLSMVKLYQHEISTM